MVSQKFWVRIHRKTINTNLLAALDLRCNSSSHSKFYIAFGSLKSNEMTILSDSRDFEIGGNVVIRDFLRRKLWTRGLDGKFMVLWRVMASSHRARKRQKCAIFNSLPNQNEKVSQSSLSSLSVSLSLYLALLTGRGIFSSLKSIPLRIGSSLLIQKTLPTVTFSQL